MAADRVGAVDRGSTRAIALLAAAAFVATATLRVADPLIPQIAQSFGSTVAGASVVATGAALSYGLFQIVYGAVGERFGKFTVVTVVTLGSALTTAAAALADSLLMLGVLRFLTGATAACVIPLAVAHIGDVVPYEGRQAVLGRFLSGQILGVLFGQAFGGILGDHLSWRGVFLVLGTLHLFVDGLLWLELASGRIAERRVRGGGMTSLPGRYLAVLRIRRARSVLGFVTAEGFLLFGGLTYIAAYLRHDFALGYGAIGGVLAGFGAGGMIYSITVTRLVPALGERGMAAVGGALMAVGFAGCALAPAWPAFFLAASALGLGFYMHHATLQTNATQMAPEARGFAIGLFAFSLYVSQAIGVALCGVVIELLGYRWMFGLLAPAVLTLGLCYAASLPPRKS